MLEIKTIISLVLAVVIAVVLVPTIWDTVYTDVFKHCTATNSSEILQTTGNGTDCTGVSMGPNHTISWCAECATNSTTKTLLKLVPMLFVALLIIAGILLATGYKVPGT